MRRIYIFCSIAFALFLMGCAPIHIELDEASDPLEPTFNLSRGRLSKEPAPVYDISVTVKTNGSSRGIWGIHVSEPGRTEKLTAIKYGEVPPGFREDIIAQKLQAGPVYAFIWRYGDFADSLYFKIIDKDGRLELKTVE